MNCREINHLLDTNSAEGLTPAQGDTVDRHLGSCHACREEWASWREIAALPMLATPAGLGVRIAAALPAEALTSPRRLLRPFLVGGALFAGAALAATLTWRATQREPQAAGELAIAVSAAVPGPVQGETELQSLPAPVGAVNLPPDGSATERPEAAAVLDPVSIVVFKRHEVAADAEAIALADRCHDAVVRELRTFGDLNVMTDTAVFTSASFADQISLPERDRKIARARGAGKALVISTSQGCTATLFNSETGAFVQGAGGAGVNAEGDRAERFGKGMAWNVQHMTLLDRPTEVAEGRATLLDAALSDRERAGALTTLMYGRGAQLRGNEIRNLLDKEVIAAVIHLGTKSPDAGVRGGVWAMLRRATDPSLVQPLLQTLANDQDRTVRRQATFTLHAYIDKPEVRQALQRAAAEDPDTNPTMECCDWTVREAAERASVPGAEFRNWVRGVLLDEKRSARSRLLNLQNLSPDGRFAWVNQIGMEAPAVVFDIGRQQEDPHVRKMAWDALSHVKPEKEFVPLLLSDMRTHTDAGVRASAAQVLTRVADDPAVREAFERAVDDPSIEVRRVAASLSEGANTPR